MHTPHRLTAGALLPSPVRTAALALAAVALMLLSVLLPGLAAPAHASVSGIHVDTSAIGNGRTANVRVAASRTSAVAYTVRNGQALTIECQTTGGRLGFGQFAGGRTWDRLFDGRYIHDLVTDTAGDGGFRVLPSGGWTLWTRGIPRCTPEGPVAAPTPTTTTAPTSPAITSTPTTTPAAPTPTTAPSAPAPSSPSATAPAPASATEPTSSPATSPTPSGTTGYTATTHWMGGGSAVNVRREPSTTAEIATTVPSGSPLIIACQVAGSPLGFSQYASNRTWDRLTDGTYVHDVLTTTPGGTRSLLPDGGYTFFSPNIPQCDRGTSAAAAASPVENTGDYPAADAQDCSAQFGKYAWCVNGSWYSPDRRFAYRNCTDYVAWRLNLRWSDVSSNNSGNAIDWRQGWINRGRTVSTTPKVGAVAWWGTSKSAWGHVGVVIAVNGDGTARIAQYNGAGDGRYSETTERAEAYLY